MSARNSRPAGPAALINDFTGAGIADTDDDVPAPTRVKKSKLTSYPWRLIAPNPLNPRRDLRFATDPTNIDLDDFEDIAESGENDVPSTIVTKAAFSQIYPELDDRLIATYPEYQFVVVWGSRRWFGSKKHDVDLKIILDDKYAATRLKFRLGALKENIKRKDISALDEAAEIADLVDLCDGSQAEAARMLGWTPGFISQRLNLNSLTDELKAVFKAGDMTVEQGRDLGKLPAEEQLTAWEQAQATAIYAVNTSEHADQSETSADEQSTPPAPAKKERGRGRPRTSVSFKLNAPPSDIAKTMITGLDEQKLTAVIQELSNHATSERPHPAQLAAQLRAQLSAQELQQLVAELAE